MTSSLDWIAILGVLGSIASLVGLGYAFVVGRQAQYRKLLAYEVTHPLPLASILPDKVEHRLSIVYEREGAPPLNVRGAFVRFVQIGNLGREPVRRADIAAGDPLRLEVTGAAVLDVALAGVSRPVIDFALGPVGSQADGARVSVSFDFLDFKDSGIVRILTDAAPARVALRGTIIGMPQGIVYRPDLEKRPFLNPLGCVLAVVLQLTALIGALWVFRAATGSWRLLWVLLLPIVAVAVPGVVVALVASFLWPKGPQWPKTPSLPEWFISRHMLSRDILFDEPFGALVLTETATQSRARLEGGRAAEQGDDEV